MKCEIPGVFGSVDSINYTDGKYIDTIQTLLNINNSDSDNAINNYHLHFKNNNNPDVSFNIQNKFGIERASKRINITIDIFGDKSIFLIIFSSRMVY